MSNNALATTPSLQMSMLPAAIACSISLQLLALKANKYRLKGSLFAHFWSGQSMADSAPD